AARAGRGARPRPFRPPPRTARRGRARGARLLGGFLPWASRALPARHAELIAALRAAGLDEGLARQLAPRHAFRRACRKLARQRVIRAVSEDEAAITFQFTAERRAGRQHQYELEALLRLDKATGAVICA